MMDAMVSRLISGINVGVKRDRSRRRNGKRQSSLLLHRALVRQTQGRRWLGRPGPVQRLPPWPFILFGCLPLARLSLVALPSIPLFRASFSCAAAESLTSVPTMFFGKGSCREDSSTPDW
ncbi:hypothetical protein MAPG_07501 [Magnaporthiopsis poae ATCC 64411]|uniref:Uncharacterized protein n=1 Tax=Magnaporthiopsis poae (strain ATCC 64411 / 73-15) TaxID=644358 RepID=A0A0C4E4U9_MAGP6|nr:hypothetical protein MAPG_07501 [Magnaporthiopsis poae ATCC 64411]